MTSLNVKYNNEKSYDFTRPDLPSGEGQGLLGDPATALRQLQSIHATLFLFVFILPLCVKAEHETKPLGLALQTSKGEHADWFRGNGYRFELTINIDCRASPVKE